MNGQSTPLPSVHFKKNSLIIQTHGYWEILQLSYKVTQFFCSDKVAQSAEQSTGESYGGDGMKEHEVGPTVSRLSCQFQLKSRATQFAVCFMISQPHTEPSNMNTRWEAHENRDTLPKFFKFQCKRTLRHHVSASSSIGQGFSNKSPLLWEAGPKISVLPFLTGSSHLLLPTQTF